MLGGVLAISDFMLILMTSALWVGAAVLGLGLVGLSAVGGLFVTVRRWSRRA